MTFQKTKKKNIRKAMQKPKYCSLSKNKDDTKK